MHALKPNTKYVVMNVKVLVEADDRFPEAGHAFARINSVLESSLQLAEVQRKPPVMVDWAITRGGLYTTGDDPQQGEFTQPSEQDCIIGMLGDPEVERKDYDVDVTWEGVSFVTSYLAKDADEAKAIAEDTHPGCTVTNISLRW